MIHIRIFTTIIIILYLLLHLLKGTIYYRILAVFALFVFLVHISYLSCIPQDGLQIHPQGVSRPYVDPPANNKCKDRLQWHANDVSHEKDALDVTDQAEFDVEKALFLTSIKDDFSGSEDEECAKEEAAPFVKKSEGNNMALNHNKYESYICWSIFRYPV